MFFKHFIKAQAKWIPRWLPIFSLSINRCSLLVNTLFCYIIFIPLVVSTCQSCAEYFEMYSNTNTNTHPHVFVFMNTNTLIFKCIRIHIRIHLKISEVFEYEYEYFQMYSNNIRILFISVSYIKTHTPTSVHAQSK